METGHNIVPTLVRHAKLKLKSNGTVMEEIPDCEVSFLKMYLNS
jgi:hypothetical protein